MLKNTLASASLLLLGLTSSPVAGQPPAAPNSISNAAELEGVWAARLRYGPDVRGTILVSRRNGKFVADVAGKTIEIEPSNDTLGFSLPDDSGAFRGRVEQEGQALVGSWIQPPTNAGGGQRFASPIKFVRLGQDKWLGNIAPLMDSMTLYLSLTPGEKGTAKAFIRNPERNIGINARATKLERDGNALKLFGNFGGDREETILATGFFDPNNDQLILHFSRFGATFTFELAQSNADYGFYPREQKPSAYAYSPPPLLGDGWKVDSLEGVGISRAPIAEFIQSLLTAPMGSLDALQVHGLLIARHGKLVLEEYFHGFDRNQPHDTRSAAKSITSVLVGAAVTKYATLNAGDTVVDSVDRALLPAKVDPRMRNIRIEHLLTMSSGYFCDDSDDAAPGNEDRMQSQRAEKNWWRYSLAVPMASEPGSTTIYCSMNPNLLGAILRHKTQQWGPDLFRSLVADPLQMNNYHLNIMPNGEAYFGGGMYLEPRDFLKLGQLVLNGGTWNNKRVLSKAYLKRATSPIKELNGVQYGYLWWVTDLPYQGSKVRAIYAGGNGGQVVMAIPQLDLVVAILAGNYGDSATFIPQRVLVPKFILPAITMPSR